MPQKELHPIAVMVLKAFGTTGFFRSYLFAKTLAEIAPDVCATWALNLVEDRVHSMVAPTVIVETLDAVRQAIESPSQDFRPMLDELSWLSWASGSFDDSSPYLQRAVARLGWATIWLTCHRTESVFESQWIGRNFENNDNQLMAEMINQNALAVDMTYTETPDGRLIVAHSFSREMASIG